MRAFSEVPMAIPVTASEARANLYRLIDETTSLTDPC